MSSQVVEEEKRDEAAQEDAPVTTPKPGPGCGAGMECGAHANGCGEPAQEAK